MDSRDNLNQKASVTAEMLISFAMAENGKKIGKPLRGQRQYLRERYGALSDAEKRGFTRHLMHSAEVMQHYWAGKDSASKNCSRTLSFREQTCMANGKPLGFA